MSIRQAPVHSMGSHMSVTAQAAAAHAYDGETPGLADRSGARSFVQRRLPVETAVARVPRHGPATQSGLGL